MGAFRNAAACPAAVKYACFSALLLLCGCGGPSADDIENALRDLGTQYGGAVASMAPKIEDVSNVSCREAQGKPGYLCSFKAVAFNPLTNSRTTNTAEARFVQDGSKWAAVNER